MNKNKNDVKDEPEYNKVDAFLHKIIDPNFWMILVVLTVVLALFGAVAVYNHAADVEDGNDLARRLGDSGWVLFTTTRCSYCITQKDILGSIDGLTVVECDVRGLTDRICSAYNITTVPTWYNIDTEEFIDGLQSVEQLELMING